MTNETISLNDYTIKISEIECAGPRQYAAEILEISGCCGGGFTADEALSDLKNAFDSLVRYNTENNIPIPRPRKTDYSGYLTIRIPKTLHQELSTCAQIEGLSLNQYMVYSLSRHRLNGDEHRHAN